MIVTVDLYDLKEAIAHIKPIASGNQIAALACILLDAHGDKLTLEATDMEQRISITVDAAVDEEGKALISCKKTLQHRSDAVREQGSRLRWLQHRDHRIRERLFQPG